MALKTITKTCPFCKKVYEQRSFNSRGKTVTQEDRWLFGSPMRMCPACKQIFLDTDVQEIAITGMRSRDKAVITAASCKLALMGVILGALLYVAGLTTFGMVAAGVGVLCALVDLGLYPTRMKKLKAEQAASEKRLSDPKYARMLKKAGYHVPDEYLKEEE